MAATITPKFLKCEDKQADLNFQELKKLFAELSPLAAGRITGDVVLAVGDNTVRTPIPKPRGRLTVYQSAAADLFDGGSDGDGGWVINASAACTCRFLFF